MALPPSKPGYKAAAVLQDPRAQEEAQLKERHRTEALADACAEVEEDLEALKARFEMFFLGVERREPAREREEMKRRVARLKGEFTRNAGVRFRIETLHARFLSYERMWIRGAREKEAGTYRRDVMRARRKAEAQAKREAEQQSAVAAAKPIPAASPPAAVAAPLLSPVAKEPTAPFAAPPKALGQSPLTAKPAVVARVPSPVVKEPTAPSGAVPPKARSGLPEPQMRALFDAYVEAKKRCNEDTTRVSYEGLAKTVAKQIPELMAQYKAKSVDFKVVIKNGRAVLKAVPRI